MLATSDKTRQLKLYGNLRSVPLRDVAAGIEVSVSDEIYQTVIDRFCGHPDFADEEIAASDPKTVASAIRIEESYAADLIECHKRMLARPETGSGSWPAGCHPTHTNRNAFTWHTNHTQWSRYSHWVRKCTSEELQQIVDAKVWQFNREEVEKRWADKPMYRVAIELTMLAYMRKSVLPIEVPSAAGANCRITCAPIPGSTIGLGWYNNGRCSDSVEARHDSGYRTHLHSATFLVAHEVGHTNRLPHIFPGQNSHRSIMSYSPSHPFQGFREGPNFRVSEWSTTIPRDPANQQLIRQYGDQPFSTDLPNWGYEEW